MEALSIGQAARGAGVGIETMRFYERQGLIEEPPRTESGYRQYPQEVVARLRFIKRAKELGFSLKEIRDLLSLRVDAVTTCDDVRERAEAKIAEVQEKIRTLRKMKRTLEKLVATCNESGSERECSILETLYAEEDK